MSVSYAVDFLSLILLGPNQTMIVGRTSAWSQCTFRMQSRHPMYRTLFSMASLVLSVQAAGLVFTHSEAPPGLASLAAMAKPLVGAASRISWQHAAGGDRHRPLHPPAHRQRVERELSVERAQLFRGRAGGRRGRVRSSGAAATGSRCSPPRRSI